MSHHRKKRILIVGVGGLGSPAARALAQSGVAALRLVDDDIVDRSNLHRQVLFVEEDVGAPKVEAAARSLRSFGAHDVETVNARFVPGAAFELLQDVAIVVEGSDNFATKFLVADAGQIAGIPVIHGGAVRWGGWAFSASGSADAHAPCLRCVFEDVPAEHTETCAADGVVGPVVGVLGALQALLALRTLRGEDTRGQLYHYRALEGRFRSRRMRSRPACPHARGQIRDLRADRYTQGCAF